DTTAWRRRMAAGIELLAAGRHAPADRALRQAIAALARRRDWEGATRGSLALADSLVVRGRPCDAVRLLEDARPWAADSRRPDLLVDMAVTTGVSAVDDLRLEAAEALLSGARDAAGALRDARQTQRATLALARCLF